MVVYSFLRHKSLCLRRGATLRSIRGQLIEIAKSLERMSKPFLIIQLRPEDEVANSEFAAILRYGGLREDEVTRERIEHSGLPDIELDRYSGIIVGGSPLDVGTPEDEKTVVQKKIENDFMNLFEQLAEADFPFLGACSGNSLLGKFCGVRISGKYSEPVGGVDIVLTKEGEEDPLLEGFPASFRALLGHKEACDDVPPGTVLLASSDTCPVQMFRLGSNIYATQFHPEGDLNGFSIRINAYKNHGYFAPETAHELIAAVKKEETPLAQSILDRFVQRYRVAS